MIINNSSSIQSPNGVNVAGLNGAANQVSISKSIVDATTGSAVKVATGSAVLLDGSRLSGLGAIDLDVAPGANARSFGNNVIGSGNPTSALSLK
ncbi:hypothetical protein [Chenggangzhangella methanolivorans]|uniref:Uncharacterized protein n=1 Tax=Chenggangzhangella methanolivorans TaxID=1437009 RepID=A0A9E6R819_9HYPH|nr:hypothetical protein [Chenggangzhangella methanolivorans]QZN99743.1 hypothetical protein K6K41_24255 [Chenggangzhangella methanolivorans]